MTTRRVQTVDGVEIAYEVLGSGDPLVLVHGITESRRMWDPLLADLAAGFNVINVDLRGHGGSSLAGDYSLASMAVDVRSVLADLGIDSPPHLIGHSLGGTVVSTYAAMFETRNVINVDQPMALAGFKDQLGQLEPMLRGDQFDAAIGMVFDALFGDRIASEERSRIDALRSPKQEVVLGVWSVVFDLSVEELESVVDSVAGGISAPYLALHGIDPGADYPEWLAARIPTAVVEVWDGLGHYPHLVEPERFLNRVREFLG